MIKDLPHFTKELLEDAPEKIKEQYKERGYKGKYVFYNNVKVHLLMAMDH